MDRPLDEGAWSRGTKHARDIYTSPPFLVGTVMLDGLFGAMAVILTADPQADIGYRAAVTLVAIILGTAVSLLSVLLVQWAAAPTRQRNELRQQARRSLEAGTSPEARALEERQGEWIRELRGAAALITEELEHSADVLAGDRSFFLTYKLAVVRWEEHGHILANHGFADAHREARKAYRLIDQVNRSIYRYSEIDDEVVEVAIDEKAAQGAISACTSAIALLEAVHTSVGTQP